MRVLEVTASHAVPQGFPSNNVWEDPHCISRNPDFGNVSWLDERTFLAIKEVSSLTVIKVVSSLTDLETHFLKTFLFLFLPQPYSSLPSLASLF